MKKEDFKIFNSVALGRMFMPNGLEYEKVGMEHISPLHGRAVAIKIGEYQWLNVKGVSLRFKVRALL